MAEDQARHRQSLESDVVNAGIASQRKGVNFGFVLTLVALLGGLGLLALDKNIAGITALIVTVGSFAGTTIYMRQSQKRERSDKLEPVKQRATPQAPPPQTS